MSTASRDFEIAMLEGRGHAINFLTGYSAAFRLGPPRRHDRGDLGSDLAGSRRRNLKVPCDLEGQSQRGRVVVLGDRRDEYPRLDVDGHRVQVIRRRKTPAVLSLVDERVITEVIVCVGNEDREHDPALNPRDGQGARIGAAVVVVRTPLDQDSDP